MPEKTEHPGLYGYALVGTFGLGHSLLAWARCWLWCRRNRVAMLAPSWLHLQHRIGPLLRRERDNRQYHRLFQFDDYITGIRRLWLLKTGAAWSAERDDLEALLVGKAGGVVVFRNLRQMNEETHFHEIVGHGPDVREALRSMTKPRFRPPSAQRPHIALHVRMGDFREAPSLEALRAGAKNCRLPVGWYGRILGGLRDRVGPVQAVVYSDGSDESLSEILSMPGVTRAPHQPSVTDLLGLAQARAVVSSGSGFSMWGTYLGDSPRICFPGQRLVRVLGEPDTIDREPEVESPDELSQEFIELVGARLAG